MALIYLQRNTTGNAGHHRAGRGPGATPGVSGVVGHSASPGRAVTGGPGVDVGLGPGAGASFGRGVRAGSTSRRGAIIALAAWRLGVVRHRPGRAGPGQGPGRAGPGGRSRFGQFYFAALVYYGFLICY